MFNVETATLKALKSFVGGLSKPSKMPGYAYGLPPQECRIGGALQEVEGSVCHGCYALKGHYTMYKEVKNAQYNRLASISKPEWVPAMVRLIRHYSSDVFRWHDAGDIQGVSHLQSIVDIAKALPDTKFWIPTREAHVVKQWKGGHNDKCGPLCKLVHMSRKLPSNLCVRLSATMLDTKPPKSVGLEGLPTSTVHTKEHLGKPGESIVCGAPKRGGECGSCRACWSPKVANISYHNH
jgi:hypothetical protein